MSKFLSLFGVLSAITVANALSVANDASALQTTTFSTTHSKKSTSPTDVLPPISCNFGGSSNINTADDDDDALIVPTTCISTSEMRFGDMVQTCGVGFRCVTAWYTVERDFIDKVGVGCMPPWVNDTQLKEHLHTLRLGNTLDKVTNCSTSNCNPCKAAMDPTTRFWETIAGHEAIGVMVIVTGFVVIWVGACMRASRCGCFWKIPWLLSHPQRGRRGRWWLHPNDDNGEQSSAEPVPPKYDEAAHAAAPPYDLAPPPNYSSSPDVIADDDKDPWVIHHHIERQNAQGYGSDVDALPPSLPPTDTSITTHPIISHSRATVYE